MAGLIECMHQYALLDVDQLITDGFYFVPWTWTNIIAPLADVTAIPFDQSTPDMEIIVLDSSQDQALKELRARVYQQLANTSTSYARALVIAEAIHNATGGDYGSSDAGCIEIEAKIDQLRAARNTNVIIVGNILDMKLGVCRHRSLLFKYLADYTHTEQISNCNRSAHNYNVVESRIIRGNYLGGGHVWNIVVCDRSLYLLDIMHDYSHLHSMKSQKANELYRRGHGDQVSGTLGATSLPIYPLKINDDQISNESQIHIGHLSTVSRASYNGSTAIVKRSANATTLVTEAGCIQKLRHPNIVRIIGAVHADFIPSAIIFEDLGSVRLCDVIATENLTFYERLDVMRQLADVLMHCHEHDILHADVTPENILLVSQNGRGLLKLIDFGSSHHITRADEALSADLGYGKKPYLAPEIFAVIGPFTYTFPFAIDVYAFAVILLEMCKRQRVLQTESSRAIRNQIKNHILAPGLQTLALSCVHREPNLRPVNVSSLRTITRFHGAVTSR